MILLDEVRELIGELRKHRIQLVRMLAQTDKQIQRVQDVCPHDWEIFDDGWRVCTACGKERDERSNE